MQRNNTSLAQVKGAGAAALLTLLALCVVAVSVLLWVPSFGRSWAIMRRFTRWVESGTAQR